MVLDERPRLYFKVADAKKLIVTTNTSSDLVDRLYELIQEAGELLESQTRRRFDRVIKDVYRDGRNASHGGHVYDLNVLDTGDDLQELSGITNGDGVAIDLSNIEYRRSRNAKFYSGVALLSNTVLWTRDAYGLRSAAVKLSGIWGYGGMWRPLTTITAGINDSVTTLPVSAYTGLERDMLIKVDNEMFFVETTPSSTSVIVSRAANGSTAAAHLINAPVYEFEPEPLVRRYIKRVIQWYSELDKSPLYGTVQVGDIAAPVDMTTIPKDAAQIIEMLSRAQTIGSQQ